MVFFLRIAFNVEQSIQGGLTNFRGFWLGIKFPLWLSRDDFQDDQPSSTTFSLSQDKLFSSEPVARADLRPSKSALMKLYVGRLFLYIA